MPANFHDAHAVNVHETFRLLIEQSLGGDLSREDESALGAHLESCADCHRYKISVSEIATALGGFAFESTPEQIAQVQRNVASYADSFESARIERRGRASASVAAFVLSFLGSAVVWELSDYFAAVLHVSPHQFQLGLLLLWVAPSLLASFALPLISSLPASRQPRLQSDSQRG